MTRRPRYVVAVTGASGAAYAKRLVTFLQTLDVETHVVVSPTGEEVMSLELGHGSGGLKGPNTTIHDPRNFAAPIASGSFGVDAAAIVPCTMGTLGAIAAGISLNLIHRVADVALKEERRLVIVPRETPLGKIHLRNLAAVADAGAVVMPAAPGFYHHPESIEELVEGFVGRILDRMGIPNPLTRPWGGR